MIIEDELARIMQCPLSLASRWNPHLADAMRRFGITTRRRAAHFYAQLGHESRGLAKVQEGLNYSAQRLLEVFGTRITPAMAPQFARNPERLANHVYANRNGNGNVATGDGYRYRGRGPIQITCRGNYRRIGQLIGMPLEDRPDLLLSIHAGAHAAGAYWLDNGLSLLADDGDTVGLSKKINLGNAKAKRSPEGLADRIARTERALSILGAA